MGKPLARDIAVDVFSQPVLARRIQRHPLPEGMLEVIQIAAGNRADDNNHLSQEAAIFFLQQVLVSRENDNFRLLGLNPGASLELIKEHRRWLLKWLHPDRNHNKWESTLFARVNSAALQLEKSNVDMPATRTKHHQAEFRNRKRANHGGFRVRRLVPRWKIILHVLKRTVMIALVVLGAYLGLTKMGFFQNNDVLTNLTKGLEN
jgi:hypothetical protein